MFGKIIAQNLRSTWERSISGKPHLQRLRTPWGGADSPAGVLFCVALLGTPTFKLACFLKNGSSTERTEETKRTGHTSHKSAAFPERTQAYRAVAKRRGAYPALLPSPFHKPCQTKVWRSQASQGAPGAFTSVSRRREKKRRLRRDAAHVNALSEETMPN